MTGATNDQRAGLSRRRLALESTLASARGQRRDVIQAELDAVIREASALPAGIVAARGAVRAARKPGGEEEKKKPNQARLLIDLAQKLYDVVEDQHGQVVAVPKTAPRVAVSLKGRGNALSNRLKLDYFKRYGSPPSATGLTGAIDVLEAMASGGDRVAVHVRCVRTSDGLVIDLGDAEGRMVVVEAGSWKVTKEAPPGVVFRRTRLTGAMPTPKRGGTLDELRQLINVTDEGWDLVRAWLVLAWMPHIPVPILCVTGQQGAGKSVLGRALVSLVDPSSAPLRSMPKDLGEWQTTAAASRVVGLDNISRIKEEMSDAFCRVTTGEGAAKRQLYADEDLIVQSYRRALLLTSIDPGALKGDLGERLMPVELLRPSVRRGEEALDELLRRHTPRILGALLDLVAEVVANPMTARNAPRMADAANVMAAVDRATGGRSLDAYRRAQANVAETVLEGDPLTSALLSLMDGRAAWVGTPQDLYGNLLDYWPDDVRQTPGNARSMSERLKRITPQLVDVFGLRVVTRRADRREIELRWVTAGESAGPRVVKRKRKQTPTE